MSSNKMYSVYCHTSPDGKKYVGISCDPKYRWHSGSGYKKNKVFYEDIQKYGWDKFTHEILFEGLTYQFAKVTEYNLIKEYGCLYPKGYNLSPSGDSSNITETTREKMRQHSLGNKRSLGHRHPLERRKKISESLKKHYAPSPEHPEGIHGPNYGRKFSDESRKKMSEYKKNLPREDQLKLAERLPRYKGKENPKSRAVIRTDDKGETMMFDCISDAIRYMGENYYKQGIIRCCKGIQKEYKGYSWKYASQEVAI